MPKPTLQQALSAIQETLDEPHALDVEQRRALADLHEDIERALEATEELQGDTGQRVNAGSRDLIERLEADHPILTEVLGRVANTLTALGL